MNADGVVQLILAVVSGGVLVAIVNAVANRRHVAAETTDLITASAERIIERLEGERRELHEQRVEHLAQIAELKAELGSLRIEVRELRAELDARRREDERRRAMEEARERFQPDDDGV